MGDLPRYKLPRIEKNGLDPRGRFLGQCHHADVWLDYYRSNDVESPGRMRLIVLLPGQIVRGYPLLDIIEHGQIRLFKSIYTWLSEQHPELVMRCRLVDGVGS